MLVHRRSKYEPITSVEHIYRDIIKVPKRIPTRLIVKKVSVVCKHNARHKSSFLVRLYAFNWINMALGQVVMGDATHDEVDGSSCARTYRVPTSGKGEIHGTQQITTRLCTSYNTIRYKHSHSSNMVRKAELSVSSEKTSPCS